MVQMNVLSRDDYPLKIMLNISYFVKKLSFMMVINQRDRSGNIFIFPPFMFDQILADQITNGLRSIGISFVLYVSVKLR